MAFFLINNSLNKKSKFLTVLLDILVYSFLKFCSSNCLHFQEAYKCYIRAYDSHSLKSIFDINTLDLIAVSKSFGFSTPPFVDLPISNKPKVRPVIVLLFLIEFSYFAMNICLEMFVEHFWTACLK